jgi:hypothetical protein
MPAPGLHDLLVRWNPFRGYWVDNGFGVNPGHEFYPTEMIAIRRAQSLLAHPRGRVLVQRGAEWLVVSRAALVDPVQTSGTTRFRTPVPPRS